MIKEKSRPNCIHNCKNCSGKCSSYEYDTEYNIQEEIRKKEKMTKNEQYVIVPQHDIDRVEKSRKELFEMFSEKNILISLTHKITPAMYNITHKIYPEYKETNIV